MNNKNFGKRYDQVYRQGMQLSIWPWTSVVTILNRLKSHLRTDSKILEIGCGMGANIQLIKSLGYDFYGIDYSEYAINEIMNLYPDLAKKLKVGDFTEKLFFAENSFDVILDRASLTCNPTSKIINCIELIKKHLKPNGYFIGVNWYSTTHSEYKKGEPTEDKFSMKYDSSDSPFDPPRMHFSNRDHIVKLFSGFEIIHLEHNSNEVLKDAFSKTKCVDSWDFIARLN